MDLIECLLFVIVYKSRFKFKAYFFMILAPIFMLKKLNKGKPFQAHISSFECQGLRKTIFDYLMVHGSDSDYDSVLLNIVTDLLLLFLLFFFLLQLPMLLLPFLLFHLYILLSHTFTFFLLFSFKLGIFFFTNINYCQFTCFCS